MGGCVEPVDLSAFAKDKDVLEIIEKSASVNLTVDSEALEEGYQKITGLDTGTYYGVEEWEKTTTKTATDFILQGGGVQFVRKSGALSAAVGNIGRGGAAITGLTNDRYYRVIAAQPLDVPVDYIDYASSVGSTVTPVEGIIELPRPTGYDIVYYLTPSLPLDLTEYEIAEVSSDGSSRTAARAEGGRIMTTISAETVVHYVFFRDDGPHTPTSPRAYDFYVLKIGVSSGPPEGTITINFYKNDTASNIWATKYVEPGGTIELDGLPLPSMPPEPTRPGYTFDGWWTKDGSGDDDWGAPFTGTTVIAKVPNPQSVYAKWDAGGAACTVTFKYLDGVTTDGSETTDASGMLISLPVPDPYAGHTFLGWWSTNGSSGGGSGSGWGTQITTSTVFSASATVYGRWLEDSFGQGGAVTLNPLGGTAIVVQDGSTAVGNGSTVAVAVGGSRTITITNTGSFSTVEVKKGSNAITVGTGGAITLGPATTPIDTAAAGSHFIFITATTSDGEVQTFYFTVQVGP